MATQVNCIRKPDRFSPHEHITHIGNNTEKWMVSRDSAIRQIDADSTAFYTIDYTTMNRMYVGVVRESGKHPYLRTHADGKWNDNLLAQNNCDATCELIS